MLQPQIDWKTLYSQLEMIWWDVFSTTEVWFWMAEYAASLGEIQWSVLDNGCWNGFLGIVAATKNNTSHLCFHDVCQNSLDTAQKNFEKNIQNKTASYIKWDALYENNRGIDSCVSNLPQNPELPYCGTGWSELQIWVTLKVWEILSSWGVILTKSMSYSTRIDTDIGIRTIFHVDELGIKPCTNPNDWTDLEVQYLLLRKK